jgi:hypothetical protein
MQSSSDSGVPSIATKIGMGSMSMVASDTDVGPTIDHFTVDIGSRRLYCDGRPRVAPESAHSGRTDNVGDTVIDHTGEWQWDVGCRQGRRCSHGQGM